MNGILHIVNGVAANKTAAFSLIIGFLSALIILFTFIFISLKKINVNARIAYFLLFIDVLISSMAIGISGDILIYITFSFVAFYLGKIICDNLIKIKEESVIISITQFIIGFYLFGGIHFILNHRILLNFFGSNSDKYIIIVVIIGILWYIIKNFDFKKELSKLRTCWDKRKYIFIFFSAAIVLSYFMVFHFNIKLSWGWNSDKEFHLLNFFTFKQQQYGGYPFDTLQPLLFQNSIYVPNLFIKAGINYSIITSYNFYGMINLFFIAIIPFYISRNILKISKGFSYLSSALVLFFGAIGGPLINPYLGFLTISTMMYHNTTIFFTIPLIQLCLFFLYKYLQAKDYKSLVLSIVLLDISFFIKPNGYMIIAPLLSIIIALSVLKMKNYLINCVQAFALLILPSIFWLIYPKIFGITKLSTNTKITYFGQVIIRNFGKGLPQFEHLNSWVKILVVVILSLLGIILSNLFGNIREASVKKYYFYVLLPMFLISLLIAFIFAENNYRMYDQNFFWQIGLIGCSLMPYISQLTSTIKNKYLKCLTITVLFFHIVSGVWHLLIFDILKRIF